MKLLSIVLALGIWTAAAQSPWRVTGAPFSADQMQQGPARAEPYVIGHFYRDSAGRTRTEAALITGGWRTEIVDPVQGVVYDLDDEHKVAHRRLIEAEPAPMNITLTTRSGNGYSSWLVNIRREEPDPSLFRVPADYTVVDR
jgi:hypothetical protein